MMDISWVSLCVPLRPSKNSFVRTWRAWHSCSLLPHCGVGDDLDGTAAAWVPSACLARPMLVRVVPHWKVHIACCRFETVVLGGFTLPDHAKQNKSNTPLGI